MGVPHPKPAFDPEELLQEMEENPDVVLRYYDSNQESIEKYIEENFWEEDVERWLKKIRHRSPSETLIVRKLDYLKASNGLTNNTSMYENSALVVRRASSFKLKIYFGNRSFDHKRDDMSISFSLGTKPSEVDGTKIVCKVSNTPGPKEKWNCFTLPPSAEEPKAVQVQVNIPAQAIVSRYTMSVEITSGTKSGRKDSTFHGKSVIVLFNPFTSDDSVYMADKEQRDEYVINDSGLIYTGSVRFNSPMFIRPKKWDFAQFDEGVLDTVLDMLKYDSRHKTQPLKSWKKRHNPVYVSRVLSAMVNSNNDAGVLVGRWDGEYKGGKSPVFWSSSEPILRQWKENKYNPVKFGQCWVFSGLLTTALRALGIPARSVTNFESAHDTDANLVIDKYFDADEGTPLDASSDSVWNFHVWNEGFFRRPDLPEGFDGWQVVDATPQEVSDVVDPNGQLNQLLQCGPAPVRAIKEGRIDIGFDANFIFAEVNADRVSWLVRDNKITGIARRQNGAVGKFISTKAVGKDERHDITSEYKYQEGSKEERVAFKRAYGRGTTEHKFQSADVALMEPKFAVEIGFLDELNVGKDLVLTAKVKNITKSLVKATIKTVAKSKRHTGTTHALLKRNVKTVDIKPGEVHEVKVIVAYDDYRNKLVDGNVITVCVLASDTADGSTVVEELDVDLVPPNCISVKSPQTLAYGKETEIEIVVTNLMPKAFTKGHLEVFPRGAEKRYFEFEFEEAIQPGQSYSKKIAVIPKVLWNTVYFNVNFSSDENSDMLHSFRTPVGK